MLTPNSSVYLTLFTSGSSRVITPGKVLDTYDNTAKLQFPLGSELKAGAKLVIFADWRGKFHSQSVLINNVKASNGNSVIDITTDADPVLCSEEETFRISALGQNILLSVDNQINCQLADLGEEGLSVITQQPLRVGQSVSINLTVDGIYATGTMSVAGQEKLPGGQTAFTLEVTEKKCNLRKSLESLSATLQRKQLRKLTAAA
ncbi:MAG TPA: hypothetical protein PLD59_10820 [Tepidisphaeraceae bacterium]|nr:hypothetical protein [Tepidisphaeraceae bacterium]